MQPNEMSPFHLGSGRLFTVSRNLQLETITAHITRQDGRMMCAVMKAHSN